MLPSRVGMKRLRTLAGAAGLAAVTLACACSIEGTQPLGAICVQTRECVGFQDGGVACLPSAGGNNVCTPNYVCAPSNGPTDSMQPSPPSTYLPTSTTTP